MPISKDGKHYFTDEQYGKARYDSSALEYAKAQGYDLVKKGKYYTLREHDSMVFTERGTWFWNSRDIKGGAIEFLTIYEHKTMVEAVLTLAGENVRTQQSARAYQPRAPEPEPAKGGFQLPERNGNHRRAFAYLTQARCIDGEIVGAMLKCGKLYETQKHHNAAFVFQDNEDKVVGAYLRGTITTGDREPFMGIAANSDRVTGYFYFGRKDSTVACVFESAIDAMSYATMQKLSGNQGWAERYYVASCGAGDANILNFLHGHPSVDTVILCQDNDKAGHAFAESLAGKLRAMDYNVSRSVPKGKDFNDDLRDAVSAAKGKPLQWNPQLDEIHAAGHDQLGHDQFPDDVNSDIMME